MKTILITGANGFVGRNLSAELSAQPSEYRLLKADADTPDAAWRDAFSRCDFVVHLAGVNRPKEIEEFESGNAGLTDWVLRGLRDCGNPVPVLITSSIQSDLENPYGVSKRAAEQSVLRYGRETGSPVYVFKLPNLFGKWSRPNYNSVVATFCHNIARGLPIQISDPARQMTLLYIDDLLALITGAIRGDVTPGGDGYCPVGRTYTASLRQIADSLYSFRENRDTLVMPALTGLSKALYTTYLSYLDEGDFACRLTAHSDARGSFYEFFKTNGCGQFSVSTSGAGVTRGNHWHHTKVEKFLVLFGRALIRLRKVDGTAVVEYITDGAEPTAVDIPPGYTHSITNLGDGELITLIWANELFDPERPDTYFMEV